MAMRRHGNMARGISDDLFVGHESFGPMSGAQMKTKQSDRLAQQKLTSRDSFRKETKQLETKQRILRL